MNNNKLSRIFAYILIPAFVCSCDITETHFTPQNFNWDITSFTEYSDINSIGPDSLNFAANQVYQNEKPPYHVDGLSWAGMGTSLLTGCASGLGSFLTNKLLSYAFSDLMQSEEVKLLNKVIKQLDEMDSKLDDLTSIAEGIYAKLDETELNEIIEAFNQVDLHLETFKRVNNFFYERLNNALAAGASDSEIASIVREWGNTTVNGTTAYIAAQSLASEILKFNYKYNGTAYNYCMVFDMIAFDSFPWERLGYDYREMYRATAAAELARSLYLSAAYYKSYEATASIQSDIIPCAEILSEFFAKSPVIRHYDEAICQINGAHVAIKLDALVQRKGFTQSFRGKYMNSDETITAEGEISAVPSKEETAAYLASQLKDSEVQAIIAYYKAVHPYDYTLMDCFADGGMKVNPEFKGHYTISEKGEVDKFDAIFFGTSDTKFYCHAQDPLKNYSDPISFGIKDFYIVGMPVGGAKYLEIFVVKIPGVCGWKTAGEYVDPEHGDSYKLTVDPNRSSSVKDGIRHYNDWKLDDAPHFTYPDTFIMLQKGSLRRY